MRIKEVAIRNFKTFDDVGVRVGFGNLTALVGENSAGKSNVLEALEHFFNFSKTRIKKNCFHHEDISLEISIEVTFDSLSESEKKRFRPHLSEDNESLIINQVIQNSAEGNTTDESAESDVSAIEELNILESKHGTKWIAKDHEWLNCYDKVPTKTNIKAWWKSDLKLGDFDFKTSFTKTAEPSPEEFQEQVNRLWSEKPHLIEKEKVSGDEKVLGWKNKLKGNLPRYFLVPALKNLEDELKATKTSPFTQIISYLTNVINKEDRAGLQEKTKSFIDSMIKQMDKDDSGASKLATINRELNENVGIELDCRLHVQFESPDIEDLIVPKLYADDGFDSEITQKGHGIQRMALFSLLRTFYKMKDAGKVSAEIIIGIEEPEIYLHAPIKRATYSLFRNLSEAGSQIAYTTHDGHFVKVEYFDEIRLFRRTKNANGKHSTAIFQLSVLRLTDFFKKRFGKDIPELSFRHRFQHICDESKNEGFFAKKAILIEGETEKYALPTYFKEKGFDLDNEKIAIISAGSVDNITYLFLIFNMFGIPCYVVFDGDKPSFALSEIPKDKRTDIVGKSRRNKEIVTLLGDQNPKDEFYFPSSSVNPKYAIWEKDFESVFHKQLDIYDSIKSSAKELYASDSKPLTGRFFASTLVQDHKDKIHPYISDMITNIRNITQPEQFT